VVGARGDLFVVAGGNIDRREYSLGDLYGSCLAQDSVRDSCRAAQILSRACYVDLHIGGVRNSYRQII
jgi:hypothetical protein